MYWADPSRCNLVEERRGLKHLPDLRLPIWSLDLWADNLKTRQRFITVQAYPDKKVKALSRPDDLNPKSPRVR